MTTGVIIKVEKCKAEKPIDGCPFIADEGSEKISEDFEYLEYTLTCKSCGQKAYAVRPIEEVKCLEL